MAFSRAQHNRRLQVHDTHLHHGVAVGSKADAVDLLLSTSSGGRRAVQGQAVQSTQPGDGVGKARAIELRQAAEQAPKVLGRHARLHAWQHGGHGQY